MGALYGVKIKSEVREMKKILERYPNGYSIFEGEGEYTVVVTATAERAYSYKDCGKSRRGAELQIRHHQKHGKWF
jgi:hypothetical protein